MLNTMDEGTDRNGTVLLVHGLAMDLTVWDPVAARLVAAGYRTVRMDLRGHGGSEVGAGGYTFAGLSGDILAVLDQAGVERAHLIGHSLGGSLVVEAALRRPGRVASVSVLDGIVAGAPASPVFVEWMGAVLGLAQRGLTALLTGLPATVMYRPGVSLGLRDAAFVPESFGSAHAAATAPRTSWDRVRAGEPGVPLLVLFGEGDPASAVPAADLTADVPQATGIDLPDAGHLSILDQPAAVSAALIDFLRSAALMPAGLPRAL